MREVLQRLHELLGKPNEEAGTGRPGEVVEVVRQASEELMPRWGQKLSELVVKLIEAPEYRLAGAEEALRQLNGEVEEALKAHEDLARELQERAGVALQRIQKILENPEPPTPAKTPSWKSPFARRSEVLLAALRETSLDWSRAA